jgi:hypothetical protein
LILFEIFLRVPIDKKFRIYYKDIINCGFIETPSSIRRLKVSLRKSNTDSDPYGSKSCSGDTDSDPYGSKNYAAGLPITRA